MSLLSLSDELLIQIITNNHSFDSQKMVRTAMLTCRRLHAVATTVFYSRVICYKTSPPYMSPIPREFTDYDEKLKSSPERARSIKFAHIACPLPWLRPDIWDTISSFLPKLQSLDLMRFQVGPRILGVRFALPQPGPYETKYFDDQRNFMQLLQVSPPRNLHYVAIDHQFIVANEIIALCSLPSLQVLQIARFQGRMVEPRSTTTVIPASPSALTTLEISSDIIPKGVVVEYLFNNLNGLKKLHWKTEPHDQLYFDKSTWSPQDVEKALAPFQDSLEHLRLSIIVGKQHTTLPHISFLSFRYLSHLDVCSCMLFPIDNQNSERVGRLDLADRLPYSLKWLQIRFGPHSSIFDGGSGGSENTGDGLWFIHILASKPYRFPGFEEFKLVEVDAQGVPAPFIWIPPLLTEVAFSHANVSFRVALRAAMPKSIDCRINDARN